MPGTVTVVVAPPTLGRAGRLRVEVNGVKVGKVRQGTSLELALNPGVHRFRVWGGGFHSRAVSLSVTDDSQQQLYAGVRFGAPLIWAMVVLALIVTVKAPLAFVIIAATALIPGHYYYLRPTAMSPSAEALEDAEEEGAAAASGEPWWVNDPNLAKRYRRG